MVKILVDLARSPHVSLSRQDAIRLLSELASIRFTRDLEEALRIVRNFEEYLRYSRRKFEEYINIPKDPRDVLAGRVFIHRVRLFVENSEEMVEIVFDRRVSLDVITSVLRNLGFSEIVVEEQKV
ncbi:MAG: hypothetical protein OWQ48_06085 [Desulfurococcus sp.]|nr:hypothetical protein [Desulfurococcus sp.]